MSSTPASGVYKYSDASGNPSSTTATAADGNAFFLSIPSGTITVTASKAGTTFKSHALIARPGALTTTWITN